MSCFRWRQIVIVLVLLVIAFSRLVTNALGSPNAPGPRHSFSMDENPTQSASVLNEALARHITAQNISLASNVKAIDGGDAHTCALMTTGGVKCWGDNSSGQLGDGTTTQHLTPVDVSGLPGGVTAIAAGGRHTCALTSIGGVKCWGANWSGQLGDGTTTQRLTPVDVSGLTSGVKAITAVGGYTCALTSTGGVECWGSNGFGQLGDNSTTDRLAPVSVSGLSSGMIAIVAGGTHTCVLTNAGGVKCWGANWSGQLGDNTMVLRLTPVNVSGLASGATALAVGDSHTCALMDAVHGGGVECWGKNIDGELGDGTITQHLTPINVIGLASGVMAIAAGDTHTCAVTSAGGVRCWGWNGYGQLGDGTSTERYNPVNVSGLTNGVMTIAAGQFHTCALMDMVHGGGVKCWGAAWSGQTGDGTPRQEVTPVNVSSLSNGATAITAGGGHTCAAIRSDGAKCWGNNFRGQLGDGTHAYGFTPVNVSDLTGVLAITAGDGHTCALTSAGGVKCWGDNLSGQLGDGTLGCSVLTPVDVSGLTSGVTAITAAWYQTCALTSAGGVKCWGDNSWGQLGDGTTTQRLTPVDVSGLTAGVTAIAAGGLHTCALMNTGGVKCWGANWYGQLGDGTTTQRLTPMDVSGLTGSVTAIAAGWVQTCALMNTGGVKCWGANSSGQLGDGTTTQRLTPVDVGGLTGGVTAIAAGGVHICALTSTGGVKCWGDNSSGQLGDGTKTQHLTPVDVSGLTSDATTIAAGNAHTCALTSTGGVKCWGDNSSSQLGNGVPAYHTTPVDVIWINEVEINQVLGQQLDGAKKFVAGKDTAIRVFLSNPTQVNQDTQQVVVKRDGNTITTLYPQPVAGSTSILTFLCPSRAACGNWQQGNYSFEATVNGVTSQALAAFQPRKSLRILVVPVKVKGEGVVTIDQMMTAGDFLWQVYPIANDGLTWEIGSELDATGYDLTQEGLCGLLGSRIVSGRCRLWQDLENRQPSQCKKGVQSACYDKIIGFIPPMMTSCSTYCAGKCGCLLGWTEGNNSRAVVVMANGSFNSTCPAHPIFEIDDMYGTVAHEVGHTFGLGDEYDHPYGQYKCDINPPPPNYHGTYWGGKPTCNSADACLQSTEEPWPPALNSGTGSLITATTYRPFEIFPTLPNEQARGALNDMLSFMGSGKYQRDLWVTPRIYDHLFDRLAPSVVARFQADPFERVILASGWISANDLVFVNPWISFTSTLTSSMMGTYVIEAVDSLSQTLTSQGFNVSFISLSNPPHIVDQGPFEVVVGFPEATQAFRIKRDNTILQVIPVSANSPAVSVTAPITNQLVTGVYTITWQASDLDGGELYHTVEYSQNGLDWIVLTAVITETHFAANFDALPGSSHAMIRVTTMDGVNTAEGSGPSFVVSTKPPEVFITAPISGTRYIAGMTVALFGRAYDPQDGWLHSNTELVWNSDRDGELGSGEMLNLQNLSSGQHTITLSATNSFGLIGTGQVAITVGPRVFLPLIAKS